MYTPAESPLPAEETGAGSSFAHDDPHQSTISPRLMSFGSHVVAFAADADDDVASAASAYDDDDDDDDDGDGDDDDDDDDGDDYMVMMMMTTADMYSEASSVLRAAGYEHYELSNYALPGHRCRHNMTYWTGGEFYAFGLGASSYLGGRRFARPRKMAAYKCEQQSIITHHPMTP